jgi:DNA-binding NarL/FixJ family response regulator
MSTRVLVADSHLLFRTALCAAIDQEPDLTAVGAPWDARAVLAASLEMRPDVILLDISLHPAGGLDVCTALKSRGDAARVLMLSEEPEQRVLLAALEAGADGYVARTMTLGEVVGAIRLLHSGEASVPSGMLGVLLRRLIDRRREEDVVVDRYSRLSKREREVLTLVVDGLDNRAIADALVVSPHTARTHIQNVLEKLEVHSRLEAVALASEHGLVERFGVQL